MEEEREQLLEEEEEKRKEAELKEQAEIEKVEAEKAKAEDEEYQKWKDMLVLENEGNLVDDQKTGENLLAKFVEFVKVKLSAAQSC